jgi:anthraniloyl-CoA monooxygenase
VRVRTREWFHGNVVLVGDAAHTAHFSVGSVQKLAMEDAIALARVLAEDQPIAEALPVLRPNE